MGIEPLNGVVSLLFGHGYSAALSVERLRFGGTYRLHLQG
jgi:hypothetical protein